MEYDISNTDSFAHQGIVILNVFIAIVLAALVGFERESNNKPAGLRTNMIIAAVPCYWYRWAGASPMSFQPLKVFELTPSVLSRPS